MAAPSPEVDGYRENQREMEFRGGQETFPVKLGNEETPTEGGKLGNVDISFRRDPRLIFGQPLVLSKT